MSEPMNDERLSEIRARYNTTTKGEWGYDLNHTVAVIEDDGEWGISVCQIPRESRYATNQDRCDMEFIVMAHKYLPALVDEIEQLHIKLHSAERLQELTLDNEIRWMRKHSEIEAKLAASEKRVADMREAIKEAPCTVNCASNGGWRVVAKCDCWKSDALSAPTEDQQTTEVKE